MISVSNPSFLAAVFTEASVAFILLVIYKLLSSSFPARFLRYWLAGWAIYVLTEGVQIYSLMRGGSLNPPLGVALSFVTVGFFFATALECRGEAYRLKYLWPWGLICAVGLICLRLIGKWPYVDEWTESLVLCALYLATGWILWRSQSRHHGIGWKLLGGALLLRGIHAMDRPEWAMRTFGLFRVSFDGLLCTAMGISMAVLILEASRSRTDDLNEKMRRLALITAEATQSFRLDAALDGILRHLVETLAATQGVIFLLDGRQTAESLVLRSSVSFSQRYRKEYRRIPREESWVKATLQQEKPCVSLGTDPQPTIRQWMQTEKLGALMLLRIPGKDGPLGILSLGFSQGLPFDGDQENFLVNVANLLGLTVQNVALFESAAGSRRQWRDTFDSIEDLIFVHSPEGRVLRANRAFSTRVNVEPAALIDRNVRDVLQRGTAQWVTCPYCEHVAGKPEEADPCFGGFLLATDSHFHDSTGERMGTIHVLRDLTSRHQAESRFRNLYERAREGVFIATGKGRLLQFNNSFMRILGYEDREELLATDMASALNVAGEDRLRRQRLLDQFGEVTDFEFQFTRRDGEIRTAHESSFLTRDDSGAIDGYQGFLLDVTEHKQAEIDIRRRNRELLALNAIAEQLSQAANLTDGLTSALVKVAELLAADVAAVYLLDADARILRPTASVNLHSQVKISSISVELSAVLLQQITQTRAVLLATAALPQEFREWQVREGIQIAQFVVLWAKDRIMGALVVGSREAREFSTAELNLLAAVGNQIATTIDKSLLLQKTRDAYESLSRAQEQLLQSEKMSALGQLVSGVAHELNNPLTAILGYSQLLKSEEFADARGNDYLEKLYKQAQRTHRIVQSLLSFARQHKPERTPIQLNQILEDTLVLWDVKRTKIQVHRNLDPHLPSTFGDFHQLQQVFLNILNNAADAIGETNQAGEIWICTSKSDKDHLRIEIVDNGPGVKDPARIFDPFYTTKPVGKGTGLGLSICYGIVKEHGGEIQVRNSSPRGAMFTITLPLVQVSELPQVENRSRALDCAAGKVLLVDAEESLLQLQQEILLSHGVGVKMARTSREAIEILKTNFVDGVVMDAEMDDSLSASGLYHWIEQNRPELAARVVFTASHLDDTDILGFIRASERQFLLKPFQIEEFSKAVRRLLATEMASSLKIH